MVRPKLPDYGCFPRWPQNGNGFIHPDDVHYATRMIPSERVFRREAFDGKYYHYRYGKVLVRMEPCLWLQVASEGIDIGDQVETVGVGMERELFVAEVFGMYYVRRKGCILYRLRRGDSLVPNLYSVSTIKLLTDKTNLRPGEIEHPTPRDKGSGMRLQFAEED